MPVIGITVLFWRQVYAGSSPVAATLRYNSISQNRKLHHINFRSAGAYEDTIKT